MNKTGYIYSGGDINEAVNKIITLKRNKELLVSMKMNARSFAVRNFCHIVNNKKVYAIYNSILK